MNSFTKIPAALAIAFLVVAPFHAAWAGCKSDYADAIETCRSMYEEPNHRTAALTEGEDPRAGG